VVECLKIYITGLTILYGLFGGANVGEHVTSKMGGGK
jgi:hypothetical protein